MKKLLKKLGTLLANMMFGKPYEIEVEIGRTEYAPAHPARPQYLIRHVAHYSVRKIPYVWFDVQGPRKGWGSRIVGIWKHPDPKVDDGAFPSYFAAYVRPRHVLECPDLFLSRVPGYRAEVDSSEPLRLLFKEYA